MSELEKVIISSEYTVKELALLCGVSDINAFRRKIRRVGELTTGEITTLIILLHISNPAQIFLTNE